MASLIFEDDTVISQQGIKYGFSLDSCFVGDFFYTWQLDLSPCVKACGIFFPFTLGILRFCAIVFS